MGSRCLEFELPDPVSPGGVAGLIALSNLSESLWLNRSGEPISDWLFVYCRGTFPSFPCLLVFLVVGDFWGLSDMTVVSRPIPWVSKSVSPVVLADDTPPIFSFLGWWFFPRFISPSFPFRVFTVAGGVSPWSPANEMLSIT